MDFLERISPRTTRKQLIKELEGEFPDDFLKEYGGTLRQMKRKQLILVVALIELNKVKEDGTKEGGEGEIRD